MTTHSADSSGPWSRPDARLVAVLGHPGHELAIYGLLQRHPPAAVVVVTDGGGVQRVRESQEGLRRIGLLERTRYLDFPEAMFYDALLDFDVPFIRRVAARVRAAIVPLAPTDVLCDAVEFYNPVHDITLPVVRLALDGQAAAVYEIPLVYEVLGRDDEYVVQRAPDTMRDRCVSFLLDERELDAKASARDDVYRSLHEQAGPELLRVPRDEMAREELVLAASHVAAPGAGGRGLRYERRARLLHAEGRVERMIAYADHFAPLLDGLGVPRDADCQSTIADRRSRRS